MLEIILTVIVVFVLILVIYDFVAKLYVRKQNDLEFERKKAQRQEERREWNQRVDGAKKHLVGTDWYDPVGKEEFVHELFGNKVPMYLWYEFEGLDADETAEVCQIFWPSRDRWHMGHFGDIEGHKNLRIRNAEVFLSEIRLKSGKVLSLDQIGYVDFWESYDSIGFPDGVVVFSMKGFYPNSKPEMAEK